MCGLLEVLFPALLFTLSARRLPILLSWPFFGSAAGAHGEVMLSPITKVLLWLKFLL